MNRLCLAAVFILIALPGFCEDKSWKSTGRGPLKIFIMAGQSNMEGHGLSEHIKMAAADPSTKAEFGPLMNGSSFVVRKDVWISYGSRRGGLSVGYGAKGEKVGPEIGFGRHIGELLKEQVLLIKTCWGGHSLKEKFLPPSMGGPGPSYTKMVSEVRNVISNLKTYFPEYDEKKGYEIVGLVWHQAWNDMIDRSQKSENPPYKSYTERQGALLRDLRLEFKAPNMLMVVGECGTGGGTTESNPFRVAQRAMTLQKEFKKTTRFVPTGLYWDDDPKYKSNGGYHYNGNGKIYYFKGKAMAHAMYDLMPKVQFSDLRTQLNEYSKPAYSAILSKRYAVAAKALAAYKQHVNAQKSSLSEEEYQKVETVYETIAREFDKTVGPAVSEISSLRAKKDWYVLSKRYPLMVRALKGVPSFDKATEGLYNEMRSIEVANQIRLGKLFYDYIDKIKRYEDRSKKERTEKNAAKYEKYLHSYIIKRAPDSLYGRAAVKAASELKDLKKGVQDPEYYINSAGGS